MENLLESLNKIVTNIVNGSYEKIVDSAQNGALTELEITEAIQQYPGRPYMRLAALCDLNISRYESTKNSGVVEYELWFDGEKSDLTLSCEFNLNRDPVAIVENIHVL